MEERSRTGEERRREAKSESRGEERTTTVAEAPHWHSKTYAASSRKASNQASTSKKTATNCNNT